MVELLLLLGLLVGPFLALVLLVGLLEETGLVARPGEEDPERYRWLRDLFGEESQGAEAPRE
ncbi:hypothetical protein SAMN04488243_1357 [Thermus arciformis]|uniref:Uncharacterized protein n=6 Tax=Thermus TaxID=270 RepID=A0A4Y9FCT3_9DEIN|nr:MULTISPECIES: hypothetical protein [Thermus]AEG34768.1 hypothetical protein Ththe16_2417 [Thermus thermophilus SG0.5JP17-16]AFH40200.1 hypothetical protein TtJL18_2373 [Thermus thermophilus JL-18]KHG65512.1 hypothetical protein QT17_06230 [Thermus sp. 2.9]TBH16349.1 hypothetical protein ETP66_10425 [Thermus thermamylovorans]TFU14062.1 hypothetical protein E0489_13030 [Thermus tengchongensis]